MSKLYDAVLEGIQEYEEATEQIQYIQDTLQYGCVSGNVGELIYYHDTIKWYEDYKEEINELLYEWLESSGMSISEMFGDKFDSEDSLCIQQNNQNLLAWFSYEETARNILQEVFGVEY